MNSHESSYRWLMLVLFGMLVGVNQMLVLNFAPLVTTHAKHV